MTRAIIISAVFAFASCVDAGDAADVTSYELEPGECECGGFDDGYDESQDE
jgi:hypothetical protein